MQRFGLVEGFSGRVFSGSCFYLWKEKQAFDYFGRRRWGWGWGLDLFFGFFESFVIIKCCIRVVSRQLFGFGFLVMVFSIEFGGGQIILWVGYLIDWVFLFSFSYIFWEGYQLGLVSRDFLICNICFGSVCLVSFQKQGYFLRQYQIYQGYFFWYLLGFYVKLVFFQFWYGCLGFGGRCCGFVGCSF